MAKMRQWVDRYIALGWTILPCKADEKHPYPNWREYQFKKPTKEEWDKWENGASGLALITGKTSGIVVVDCDTSENILALESTVIAQTQSGGLHFYYKWEEALNNTVRLDGAPIDFRGDGGLVMIPPTPYKGNKYFWLLPPTEEALATLPPLPEKIKGYLQSASQEVARNRVDLTTIIGTTEGSRDEQLLKAANSLCNRHPQIEWESVVWPTLVTINQSFSPPLSVTEVKAKFENAKKFVANHPKKDQPQIEETFLVDYTKLNLSDLDVFEKRSRSPIGVRDLDHRFNFPAGFYVIIGHPGAGKGFFALWLARRFFTLYSHRTVFYSLEMSEPLVRTRLLQAWSDLTQEQFENGGDTIHAKRQMGAGAIAIYPFGQNDGRYQTPENFEKDVSQQYQDGYRVFMFDHLHELSGSNNNETNQGITEKWADMFQTVTKKYPDIWLIVFAQPNGAAAKKAILTKNDILGSKSITHKAEFVLTLNRKVELDEFGDPKIDADNREVKLYVDKNRITPHQHFGVKLYFLETGNYSDVPLDYRHIDDSLVEEAERLFT